MNFYKLLIAYDGTDYEGWQFQPHRPTITGTLIKTFKKVFHQDSIFLGASRTDAGVHAQGQVARLRTPLLIDPFDLQSAWNNALPNSILIRSIETVDETFHPMHNVVEKTYIYHFFLERPMPFVSRYGWYFQWSLDFEKLKKCLMEFIGEHDFRSFVSGSDITNTVRTINSISIQQMPEGDSFRIIIKGPSFLRYMIRRIVGAALEVASREYLSVEDLVKTLQAKNPEHLLPTAPAQGLMLYHIEYSS